MIAQEPVADAVAGVYYLCQLCGKHAHAYTADDGQTLEVWDLCRTCNSAFHFLAVGLELLATAPGLQLEHVAGQLELEEDVDLEARQLEEARELVNLEVGSVVHATGTWGEVAVPACYSNTAGSRLASRIRQYGSYGVTERTADPVTCPKCRRAQ